jgi:plasmid maintenance system antidote protein VapI
MKAYCKKEEIEKLLIKRPLSFLVEEINNMGIKVSYDALNHIVNNRNACKIDYALAMAKVLKTKVENIFYLE